MSAFPELLPGMRSQRCIYFVITSAVSETQGHFSAALPSSAVGAALVSWDRHPLEGRTEVRQSQHPPLDRPLRARTLHPFLPSLLPLSCLLTSFSVCFLLYSFPFPLIHPCTHSFTHPHFRSDTSGGLFCIPALHRAAVDKQ